jgi:hypothetical protein
MMMKIYVVDVSLVDNQNVVLDISYYHQVELYLENNGSSKNEPDNEMNKPSMNIRFDPEYVFVCFI